MLISCRKSLRFRRQTTGNQQTRQWQSTIRVQCTTEEQARQLRAIDWRAAFEGIKIHKPNYGIVINAHM
jgi:hypothetical protein